MGSRATSAEMRSTTEMPASSRASTFFRIVGDEADGGDAEHLEHLGGEFEVATVGLVAELQVGFDGIAALVLEGIGLELGHETDAASFLVFIDEDAGTLGGDEAERKVKLVVAVATERVEGRLRSDTGNGCGTMGGTEWISPMDEGYGGFYADSRGRDGVVAGLWIFYRAFKAMDAEVAPAGGKVCFRNLTNGEKRHFPHYTAGFTGGLQTQKRVVNDVSCVY